MISAMSVTWLHSESAAPAGVDGCGGCLPSAAGPVCGGGVAGECCLSPELAGEQREVGRVMSALDREVRTGGQGIVERHWVKSLRIDDGEAELTVTFPARCGGGKELAEAAFGTLRRLLPETDIYVRHTHA